MIVTIAHVPPPWFEIAETWLKRSGSLPLSVRLGLARPGDIAYIAHAFLRHCGRWEYARWKLPHKEYLMPGMPFLAGRMPLLKELRMDTTTPDDKVDRVDAPLLRSLTGRLFFEESYSTLFNMSTWNQLTRLKLGNISSSFAAQILAETKQLVDCWLMLFFYRQENQPMSADLELPWLETLIIGSGTSHSSSSHVFLAALNLPGLRRLSVDEDLLSPNPLQRLPETINSFGCDRLQRLCIVHRVVALEDEYRAVFPEIEPFEFHSSRYWGWSPSIEDWGVASKHKSPATSTGTIQKGSTTYAHPLLPPTPAARPPSWRVPTQTFPSCSRSPFRDTDYGGPELRMDIERRTRVRSNDNFFPLSYILEPPAPLSTAETSEAAIAKALRAHAADTVDLRMAIPSAERKTSRKDWDARTVYVETLLVKCKTLAAACRFILGLLPSSPAEDTCSKVTLEYTRIQNITSPGPPRQHAGLLVAAWPWKRLKPEQVDGTGDKDKTDAARFGFRACSTTRWDEYRTGLAGTEDRAGWHLSYRQRAAHGPTSLPHLPTHPTALSSSAISTPLQQTALRAFFADALGVGTDDTDEAIDYVDYTVGVDSVGLFLTGTHSSRLIRPVAVSPPTNLLNLCESACSVQFDGAMSW
ncbi:hypothetical protein C8F01DRAFT_1224650 [Mycena amicta]|nr:hypothetical protein C8F01DRAFT_1224650 [Mycena amicta]